MQSILFPFDPLGGETHKALIAQSNALTEWTTQHGQRSVLSSPALRPISWFEWEGVYIGYAYVDYKDYDYEDWFDWGEFELLAEAYYEAFSAFVYVIAILRAASYSGTALDDISLSSLKFYYFLFCFFIIYIIVSESPYIS